MNNNRNRSGDVIVIGGGVIGCSIAYELAKRGQEVTLLERGRLGQEATSAAAGMLGAQSEMEDTGPLFQWSRASRNMFPRLAEELKELTGIDIGLIREGLLNVALTDAQARELSERGRLQRSAGARADWLTAAEAVRLEPQLRPDTLGALYLPDDGQVDAPLLGQALAKAAALLGAELREYVQALGLLTERGRAIGVQTSDGPLYADRIVVAAGTWSGHLLGGIGVELPMYPVKGECFSVLERKPQLRKTLFTHGCYIVPKAGGRLVVGATMEPGSYDRKVTLSGLAQLMERAAQLMPSIAEAEWERAWAGLRPQTADGLPYIDAVQEYEGLYAATGHYRNGILLSPITGRAVADMILGEAASPDRGQEAAPELELGLPSEAAGDEAGLTVWSEWTTAFSLGARSESALSASKDGEASPQRQAAHGKELISIEAAH